MSCIFNGLQILGHEGRLPGCDGLSVSASQSWFSARLSGDQDQTRELTEYRFALKFSFDTDAPSNRVQESET
jgi:hypothetical protein